METLPLENDWIWVPYFQSLFNGKFEAFIFFLRPCNSHSKAFTVKPRSRSMFMLDIGSQSHSTSFHSVLLIGCGLDIHSVRVSSSGLWFIAMFHHHQWTFVSPKRRHWGPLHFSWRTKKQCWKKVEFHDFWKCQRPRRIRTYGSMRMDSKCQIAIQIDTIHAHKHSMQQTSKSGQPCSSLLHSHEPNTPLLTV